MQIDHLYVCVRTKNIAKLITVLSRMIILKNDKNYFEIF